MRAGVNAYERAYGLNFPVNTYPLFENAIRGQKERSVEDHLKWLGQFFSPFSKVASREPLCLVPDLSLAGRDLDADAARTASSAFPIRSISTP